MGKQNKGNTTTTTTTTNKGGIGTFFTPVPKVTPQNRRGTSTVKHPVGVTWGTCLLGTHNNGGTPPTRSVLMGLVVGNGVTYNTSRTQVQRYLQWYHNGCNPTQLPKGVTIPKGTKLVPPTPTKG